MSKFPICAKIQMFYSFHKNNSISFRQICPLIVDKFVQFSDLLIYSKISIIYKGEVL